MSEKQACGCDASGHSMSCSGDGMPVEQTFALVKPDAIDKKFLGPILHTIQTTGFSILRMEMFCRADPSFWRRFYAEHEGKPFFEDLCAFMASGPVVAMVLERNDAVAMWRRIMGPADARITRRSGLIDGGSFHSGGSVTMRGAFGEREGHVVQRDSNGVPTYVERMFRTAVHGSDSPSASVRESAMFFPSVPSDRGVTVDDR